MASTHPSSVDDIFDFLEQGKAQIDAIIGENLILVLGITGAGKSTLIQYLAGDNQQLYAVEISPNTGKFVISDNNQRISEDTVISKTIFPEVIPFGGDNLVDCPGFNDTRSVKHDLGAAFVTRRLIGNANAIKIVFVINFNSVQKAEDRLSFRLMMQHVTAFLKNIEKYSNGIAFVISKVENSYRKVGKNFTMVSDEAIEQSIAAFIEELKQSFESENFEWKANIFQMLDIFLRRDESGFTNFTIFRKPDEAGPISDCQLLQDGKLRILKVIEGLEFIAPDELDFDLSISDASKLVVIKLINHLLAEISKIMDEIGQAIIAHYRRVLQTNRDIVESCEKISKAHALLQTILQEQQPGCCSVEAFIDNVVVRFIDEEDIPRTNATAGDWTTVDQSIVRANELAKKIKFFNTFDDSYNSINGVSALRNRVEQTLAELAKLKNWAQFLMDLYQSLASYSVQCRKATFKEAIGLGSDVPVTIDTFAAFLENLNTQENLKQYQLDNVDEHVLKHLNKILSVTLRRYSGKRKGANVSVEGSFVCLSDIPEEMLADARLVKVFASNKIFIDRDFQKKGAQMDLVLCAPTIELVNNHTINLDGRDADPPQKPNADNATYAKKKRWFFFTKHDMVPAKVGVPGLPGWPAGHFFAFASKVTGSGNLLVSLNGGRGGAGQHGGKGYDAFHQSPGRNGADGGKKGEGGFEGEFTFIYEEKFIKISAFYDVGQAGAAGLGGKGGIGRLAGKKCTEFPHGAKGRDNFNDKHMQMPETNTKIDHAQILSGYKAFAESCSDEMFDGKLEKFIASQNFKRKVSIARSV